MASLPFNLNLIDWQKIGKGLLIALAGAFLTYGTETIPGIDLGWLTPLVVAGWSVIVNLLRKWIPDNTR